MRRRSRRRWRPRPGAAIVVAAAALLVLAWHVLQQHRAVPAGGAASPASATAPAGSAGSAGSATGAGRGQAASSAAQGSPAAGAGGLPPDAYSPAHPPPAWPGPLPYPVLIADRGNNRMLEVTPTHQIVWRFPPKGGLPPGQRFGSDDDTFFTPRGGSVITNEEHQGTIAVVDYYTRRITWTYGHYGVLRYGNGYLDYPDDAYRLPDGNTVVADIRNCRELIISPGKRILQQWGREQSGGSGACPKTILPSYLGSPNGDTPQPNGDILMSVINGNLVALMSPHGRVLWHARVPFAGPGAYVSDAQLLSGGDVLTAIYGSPGQVVIFNPHTGAVRWHYDVASGPGRLDHPSLAERLPNGNIMLNDDYNDRVVVIDPTTKRIVWQYGVTGRKGTAAGLLDTPDGFAVDFWRNWKGWLARHPAAAQGTAAAHGTAAARGGA